jgi:penicillin-insensitive murein endopeptidase
VGSSGGRIVVLAASLACLFAGCVPRDRGLAVSYGLPHDGHLARGVSLPDEGVGFTRARPGEDTRFGLPTLVDALRNAARSVHETFANTAPLRIGDLGAPSGGAHSRHHSHRSGRDADIIFYLNAADGTSVHGRGWLAFDRFGVARETRAPAGNSPSGGVYFFDAARNWHFVRTLLADASARVQWIFCSKGVRHRLLTYALRHERDPELIVRAARVLHQPTNGNPHSDHFHVRVICGAEQRALGCRDHGPRWSWLRDEDEKPAAAIPRASDEAVVEWLLSEDAAPLVAPEGSAVP